MCGVPEGTAPSIEEAAAGREFKLKLHCIDIKLTLESSLLPEDFIVSGIKLLQDTSEKGGAHADVYEALHPDGRRIAVKKLRRSKDKRKQNRVSIYLLTAGMLKFVPVRLSCRRRLSGRTSIIRTSSLS